VDGEEDNRVPCQGLTSDWNRSAATVRLRMPWRCMPGAHGDLKFWVLIEGYRSRSSDVDYAPETPSGDVRFTRWIPRGPRES
jgi:hypothetical protein